jgi:hypothetical protein
VKRFALPTLIALAGTSSVSANAQQLLWEAIPDLPAINTETTLEARESLQWELVPNRGAKPSSTQSHSIQHTSITWEILPPPLLQQQNVDNTFKTKITTESTNQATELAWKIVNPDAIISTAKEEENLSIFASTQQIQTALRVRDTNAPTYASSRALWRNDRWHPQISYLIPNGYGPKGVMLDARITGTDCTLGKGPCEPFTTISAWQESLNSQANGSTYFNVGFGDTQSWGGVLITNSAETISSALGRGDGPLVDTNNLLQGIQTGLHYSKAIGPDTSFRTGVENLITWDNKDYTLSDMTRNFYFVGSQRLRLKVANNSSKWFRNLYLTAGIGNGEFKPIEQTFQDQTQALKDAGCATYGFAPKNQCSQERFKRALRTGSDYGQINPIASASLEVFDGLNVITEWSGRNLNAGLSWRPFDDLGIVITPMVESIVRNCEYPGCKVTPIEGFPEKVALPDVVLTDRVRLSLQVSFQVKL